MSDLDRFVYVIAGGETLLLIERLKSDAVTARKALEMMAQQHGAALSFHYDRPVFRFSGRVPQDWTASPFNARTDDSVATPDEETAVGSQIAKDIRSQAGKFNIREQFKEACAKSCGTCRGSDEYSFEEIDDRIIVKCPINPGSKDREYLVPPDSTLISFSQYAKMKEDAGLVPTTKARILPFKHKFGV